MTEHQQNYDKVKKISSDLGLKLFGVCNVSDIKDSADEFLKQFIDEYKHAVCAGYNLSPSVMKTIIDKPNKIYFRHYKMINMMIDQSGVKIGNFIEEEGFKALPIPASLILDWEMQTAHLNHKIAAYWAGLGWIGKNNLLVNPKYGSAARYITILTDMPLRIDKPLENGCGNCAKCLSVCPAGALDGGYNLEKCHEKLKEFAKKEHVGLVCGLCVKACLGKGRGKREEGMGIIKPKERVKLIVGMLSADKKLFEKVIKLLIKKYGGIDFESEFIDFKFTNYYQDEMGKNILRKFISFKNLINPEYLPDIKISSNNIEEKFLTSNGARLINIDPGYITLGKLILATTKNQQHRIYLRKGIFAEVALRYKNKTFREWEWTYPDYKTHAYISMFNKIREVFYNQISQK